jgi:hypothetical protein
MRKPLGMLSFAVCLRVTADSMAALAAETGEQELAKGVTYLKKWVFVKSCGSFFTFFRSQEGCR